MADDTLDALVVHVGGSIRGGQHQPGVEDVQTLVLHGAWPLHTIQVASTAITSHSKLLTVRPARLLMLQTAHLIKRLNSPSHQVHAHSYR